MKKVLLAVDQGTTGSTALLVDRKGSVVGRGYAELPQHFPKPGWVEHRPDQILSTTRKAIQLSLRASGLPSRAIEGIGITNQRETTLLWERRTGRALANAIVWQCRRTSAACQRLQAAGHAKEVRSKTGLVIDAYFSATKLQWLLDHVPGARKRAERGELAFGTVDTWLVWHLTNGRVHATDATNASRTLLYNIHRREWDKDLLALFHVPESVLPTVQEPVSLFGKTAGSLGLPAGVPICSVAGDQQASMVGHGCLTKGSAKNTYGTGCFLLEHTGDKPTVSRAGLLTTLVVAAGRASTSARHDRAAGSTVGGCGYALEGSVFIAGAAIQWLRDGLRIIQKASETEKIARSVKDTDGVHLVPAFVGLGAPYWDMGARGAIVGLTRGTRRETIVRAALESLAFQTRDVVDAMQRDSGVRLRELRVDGGAAQNNWLMQFQADILGIPVARPPMVENTGRGAAFLAGASLGWWKLPTVGRLAAGKEKRFQPRMPSAERTRRYAGWQEAINRVLSRA